MAKLHAMLMLCGGAMLIGVAGCAAQTEDPTSEVDEATLDADESDAAAASELLAEEENVGTAEEEFIGCGLGAYASAGVGYGGYGLGYGGYGLGYGGVGLGGVGLGLGYGGVGLGYGGVGLGYGAYGLGYGGMYGAGYGRCGLGW